MEKDKCLLDLPVIPKHRDTDTEVIVSSYLQELKQISSPEALKEFVFRWQNLFLLRDDYELTEATKTLVELNFDSTEVFNLLPLKKTDGLDYNDLNVQIMASIAAPYPLLQASLLAKKFGVGHDLVMARLYLDPFPEHENKLR